MTAPLRTCYDVVVLGAGTAGCIVAGRLAEAGLAVGLVEAGPDSTAATEPDVPELAAVRDPTRVHELWFSRLDWGWRTTPQPNAAGRELHVPRGRVVGGSHALNAMIWTRGHPRDYDDWAAAGNPGWDWAGVEPVFRALEDDGRGGPIELVTDSEPLPLRAELVAAAANLEIPFNPDYNGGDPLGISYTQLTVRDGRRWMTADAFLTRRAPRAAGPTPGAVTVLTDTLVERLLLTGGRCVGAAVRDVGTGATSEIHGDEVVLALGALASPGVLMRSGIGDPQLLAAAGIQPVLAAPAVGHGLWDHWLVPVVFATDRAPGMNTTLPPIQTHLFWSSDGGAVPNLQPLYLPLPLVPPGHPVPDVGFTLLAGLIRPLSRGRVTVTDADPLSPPSVDPAVLSDPADVDALVEGVRLCRRIAGQEVLRSGWSAREIAPGPQVEDVDLHDYIASTVETYHHAAGTCAMGPTGVVDETLAVRGVPGLRIADASIMPGVVSGNTNAAVAMIGVRAAEFVLADRPLPA